MILKYKMSTTVKTRNELSYERDRGIAEIRTLKKVIQDLEKKNNDLSALCKNNESHYCKLLMMKNERISDLKEQVFEKEAHIEELLGNRPSMR